ncbi:uncharacterized protein LOC126687457 [Mercurialis annua]|uniref:uncharacterized protein LOC126687457 n=1 Tax=Mercurialis annua TaxID=3986 RepID=UPI00215DE964|nr:uncharacterized protein LOC126687457 [Mercurialis annua]
MKAAIASRIRSVMRELNQIATMHAELLQNVADGSIISDVVKQYEAVRRRKDEVSRSLARDTNQRLKEAECAVEWTFKKLVTKKMARDDPVLKGLKSIVVIDGDGEICGVCLEEMKEFDETKAMDCMHMFHRSCIAQWLTRNKITCPLCRHQHIS